MRLALGGNDPGVERVVDRQAMAQHGLIVPDVRGETERDSEQASGLRREPKAVSIGASHDAGELSEGRTGQTVVFQEGIEGAALPAVRKRHTGNVIRNSAGFACYFENLARRDIEKFASRDR